MKKFAKRVLATSALLSGVSVFAATPAHAISTTNLTVNSAVSNGAQCDVNFSFTAAFTSADNGPADQYRSQIGNSSGSALTGTDVVGQLFSGSATVNRTVSVSLSSPTTFPLFASVSDRTPTGQYAFTVTRQIPTSMLQTAGGACLNLIPNLAPVANAGSDVTVRETRQVVLDGTASNDPEGQPLTYSWALVGGLPGGTLSATNVANPTLTAPSLNANNNAVYELTVSDGLTSRTDQVVVNYINNSAPVVSMPQPIMTAAGGSTVTVNGVVTDADGDPLTLAWSFGGGVPFTILSGGSTSTVTLRLPNKTASSQQTYARLDASDGIDPANAGLTEINIPANIGPTANAGVAQQVAGGSTVTLNAGASTDGDGDTLLYTWTQLSGPTVTLAGAATANPTFTAPPRTTVNQVMVFQVAVRDGIAPPVNATVAITVPANAAPVAVPGAAQTVAGGAAVALNGTGSSDLENDPITYAWTQTSGPTVTLTGATTATPSFTAPPKAASAQVMTFDLVVNDGATNSIPVSVAITVPGNIGPTASAGPDRQVLGGSAVTLDASASADGDGDALTYSWTQAGGPTVTLSGAGTATPTFTAPARTTVDQDVDFEVSVSDGFATTTDVVRITVPANGVPLANAGATQNVLGGASVTLSGSASSDLESDPLTYVWTQTAGPSVTLIGANTVAPTFTAPPKTVAAQTLSFELVVNDGVASSTPAAVDVIVAANAAPVASAGTNQQVFGGGVVTLNAGGSTDADGDALTYTWTQTGGPSVTLTGANTAAPTFVAPLGLLSTTTFTFEVSVSDGVSPASFATVAVDVAPNTAPTANAGADQGPINGGQTVTLDGSGSSDPENQALSYVWTQLSGTTVQLTGANTATPTFAAPLANGNQTLVFQLVVSDGALSSTADTVSIAVRAVGTVTLVQQITGGDRAVSFTSDITALNASLATVNGVGQLSASQVIAGAHTLTAQDLSGAGYALTSITCNDTDSIVNLSGRTVNLALSPGENLVCTFTSVNTRDAASKAIAEFLTTRNELVLAHQPESQRRIDRLNGGGGGEAGATNAFGFAVPGMSFLPAVMSFNGQEGRLTSSLSMLNRDARTPGDGAAVFDLWLDAQVSRVRRSGQKGDFQIAYVGADWKVSDDLLVGGLVQFDDLNWDGALAAKQAEGNGWMVGPYVTARLAPHVYADVRAAWGQSDNDVSPLDTYVDAFKTDRALYVGSLTGELALDSKTMLRPTLSVRYISDEQKAYVDRFNIAVPAQTLDQGDISLSPRISRELTFAGDWKARPYAELEAIVPFGTPGTLSFSSDARARLSLGADVTSASGVRIGFSAFHDGIGVSGFRDSGFAVNLGVGF